MLRVKHKYRPITGTARLWDSGIDETKAIEVLFHEVVKPPRKFIDVNRISDGGILRNPSEPASHGFMGGPIAPAYFSSAKILSAHKVVVHRVLKNESKSRETVQIQFTQAKTYTPTSIPRLSVLLLTVKFDGVSKHHPSN